MLEPVVELTVPADQVDVASDVLWSAGASAIEERSGAADTVVLVADAEPSAVERVVVGRWRVSTALVDAGAALDAWRPHARIERAGRHIVIRPPWVPMIPYTAGDGSELVVEIDPGRAFGSGSHPSSRLALAALDELGPALTGASVLDIGCGSGILAVVAARFGAAAVSAIDIDPAALEASTANADRNGVADRVVVLDATVDQVRHRFDGVLLNISRAAAVGLAPAVLDRLGRGGWVVLSGFLAVTADEVAAAYSPLTVAARYEEDGWAAVVMRTLTNP